MSLAKRFSAWHRQWNLGSLLSVLLMIFLTLGTAVAPANAITAVTEKDTSAIGTAPPVRFSPKIVGGASISISSAPWQVAIIDRAARSNYHGQFCGGSLVSSEWIVTAAHCVVSGFSVTQPASIGIQVGNAKLDTKRLSVLSVSAIQVHPSYSSAEENNDIALIKLSSPVSFSSSIAPISINRTAVSHNTPGLVTGWGQTGVTNDLQVVVGQYNFPTALQGTTVYVSDSSCFGDAPTGFLSSTMLCAGTVGWMNDTCQGDSGGPLAINVSGTNYLAGITSWGNGCAWLEPGIYTKVSNYASWIDSYVTPANFTLNPAPTISGIATVGQLLTASTGTWEPEPAFSYQWFAGSTAISEATSPTYLIQKSDRNKNISVRVTATKSGYLSTTMTSTPTAKVSTTMPFPTTDTPSISGSLVVGQTLTASTGVWSPDPSFSFQWLSNNSDIRGAGGSTYVLTSADLGKNISVRVTATRDGYTKTTLSSSQTAAVTAGLAFTSSPNPTISGSAGVGQTLSANPGVWSPEATFAYQWLSNNQVIRGATDPTFVVTRSYRGRSLSVQVTGTKSEYAPTTKTSSPVRIPR